MVVTKKITLSEAKEQGYTHYIQGDPDSFQFIQSLDDITPEDIEEYRCILCEKECFHPTGITSDDLKEMIAEHLEDINHEVQDDTGSITRAIKEIDFTEISELIKSKLNQIEYYKYSKIILYNDKPL